MCIQVVCLILLGMMNPDSEDELYCRMLSCKLSRDL
jgi:hypothetical protein